MEKIHKWHVVNQKEVDLIKALLDANLPYNKIAKISGRSAWVITDVKNSDGTVAGYRETARARQAARQAAEEAKTKAVEAQVEATQPAALINPAPVEHLEYLNDSKVIAKRLDHIETQIQELIDNHHAMMTILQSKKLIW